MTLYVPLSAQLVTSYPIREVCDIRTICPTFDSVGKVIHEKGQGLGFLDG